MNLYENLSSASDNYFRGAILQPASYSGLPKQYRRSSSSTLPPQAAVTVPNLAHLSCKHTKLSVPFGDTEPMP